MRILAIGLGGAGSRIVDRLYDHDRRSKLECIDPIAVDIDGNSLKQLRYIPDLMRLHFPCIDSEVQYNTNTTIDAEEIMTVIQKMDTIDIDAIIFFGGLGGSLIDAVSTLAPEIRKTFLEPIFAVCTLPCLQEGKMQSAKAADDIEMIQQYVDAAILFDNETWYNKIKAAYELKNDETQNKSTTVLFPGNELPKNPRDIYNLLNERIARKVGLLLRAGEFNENGVEAADIVLDAGEVLNTLKGNGLTAIGYAVEKLSGRWLDSITRWRSTSYFSEGSHKKATRIVSLAKQAVYEDISIPCDLTSADKALVLIAGPSQELSMKGFQTVRKWIDKSIAGLEMRSGDYPVRNTKYVGIIIMLSGLHNVPRVEELMSLREEYRMEIEMQKQRLEEEARQKEELKLEEEARRKEELKLEEEMIRAENEWKKEEDFFMNHEHPETGISSEDAEDMIFEIEDFETEEEADREEAKTDHSEPKRDTEEHSSPTYLDLLEEDYEDENADDTGGNEYVSTPESAGFIQYTDYPDEEIINTGKDTANTTETVNQISEGQIVIMPVKNETSKSEYVVKDENIVISGTKSNKKGDNKITLPPGKKKNANDIASGGKNKQANNSASGIKQIKLDKKNKHKRDNALVGEKLSFKSTSKVKDSSLGCRSNAFNSQKKPNDSSLNGKPISLNSQKRPNDSSFAGKSVSVKSQKRPNDSSFAGKSVSVRSQNRPNDSSFAGKSVSVRSQNRPNDSSISGHSVKVSPRNANTVEFLDSSSSVKMRHGSAVPKDELLKRAERRLNRSASGTGKPAYDPPYVKGTIRDSLTKKENKQKTGDDKESGDDDIFWIS